MAKTEPLPGGLTPKDIENARRSWPGQFLVRLIAMMVLLLSLAALAGDFWKSAERGFTVVGLDTQAQLWVVLGVPTILVCLWLIEEAVSWRRARRRRLSTYEPPRPGFFRVEPYDTGDHDTYSRPDGAETAILRWVKESTCPLLYLTGRSGCGKSSLLKAWLEPELTATEWVVVSVRGESDPLTRAAMATLEPGLLWQRPPEGAVDSMEMLRKAGKRAADKDKRLLIAVDQFETFLLLGEDDASLRKVRAALQELVADPPAGLRLLLIFRSEYGNRVDELGLPRLRQAESWKELGPFSRTAADQFLRGGLSAADDTMRHQLLDGIAEIEGTSGLFRPVTLNMAGLVLERRGGHLDDAPDRLIQRYVADAIAEPEVVDIAPMVLARMVTAGGTKRPEVDLATLASETDAALADVSGCLRRLGRHSLVRPLDAAQKVWEVSHDFLAHLIGQQLGHLRPKTWRIARRWAAPATLLLWLLTVAVGLLWWQANELDVAKARLSEMGFSSKRLEEKGVLTAGKDLTIDGFASATPWLELLLERQILVELDLEGVQINDIAPLASLSGLERLRLEGTWVSNLEPIAKIESLQNLVLRNTPVVDLGPLSGLHNLKLLDLRETYVERLQPLDELHNLEVLDLRHTPVSVLIPLSNLHNLQVLDLAFTKTKLLVGLQNLSRLQYLHLAETRVSYLEPISSLQNLKYLHLSGTDIMDIEPLSSLRSLVYLNLNFTNVKSVAPLSRLSNLEQISLRSTDVTDYSPISHVPFIKR